MLTYKQRITGKYIQIGLFSIFFIYLARTNIVLFHTVVSLSDIVVAFNITIIAIRA